MHATCPRCGNVSLIAAHATRVTCQVCQLRFCTECHHWHVERKQRYCPTCGANFTFPPPILPRRIMTWIVHVPVAVVLLLAAFAHFRLWQTTLIVLIPSLAYYVAYLWMFYRATGLEQAARREVVLLARAVLTVAAVVYVISILRTPSAFAIALTLFVVLVLIGLAAQRMNPAVIEELRANRHVWQAVLTMKEREAWLMRFPQDVMRDA